MTEEHGLIPLKLHKTVAPMHAFIKKAFFPSLKIRTKTEQMCGLPLLILVVTYKINYSFKRKPLRSVDRKNMSLRLSIAAIIAVMAMLPFGCGGEDKNSVGSGSSSVESANSELEEYIIAGKLALGDGKGELAYNSFTSAIDIDPASCDAHYGIILSDILKIIENIVELGELLMTFLGREYSTDFIGLQLDLENMIGAFLYPIEEPLIEIAEHAQFVGDNGCVFQLDELPLNLSFGGIIPIDYLDERPYVLGSEWDPVEAHLIGAMAELFEAALDFGLAHDIDIDFNDMEAYNSESDSPLGLIGMVRPAAVFLENSPDLLGKSPVSWNRFGEVDNDLARALQHLIDAFEYLESETDEQGDDIIGFYDEDANGIDGGDFFSVGMVEMFGTEIEGGLPAYLPIAIGRAAVVSGMNILRILRDQFEAVDTGAAHDKLTMLHLQAVFDGLDIIDLSVEPTAEVDFTPFFQADLPLREYVPLWYDNSDFFMDTPGFPYFIIELENTLLDWDTGWLLYGDSEHFFYDYRLNEIALDIETIPLDCKAPDPSLSQIVPYLAFPVPDFSGAIYIDVSAMDPEDGPQCANDPQGMAPATLYTLNKLINYYITFWFLGEGQVE
jgi:hypothetical protein